MALLVGVIFLCSAPAALAGAANSGLRGAPRGNPLAGMRWGVYTGSGDGVYSTYAASQGRTKQLMAKIALRPIVHWFGTWDADNQAADAVRKYLADVTHGDSRVLTQIAVFRLDPWEQAACSTVPGASRQGSYRYWIDSFARGIGRARTVVVLQPDMPFALCSPGEHVYLGMLDYASKTFSRLAHTTVYIDVGAADWVTVSQASALLRRAGVRWARGFALNATHYDSTQNEVLFGGNVIRALSTAGVHGKHFVVNTASNGNPFPYYLYQGDADNARPCTHRGERMCVALGIPPTTNVASRRWGLSPHARSVAERFTDAYLWFGRPWLDNQAGPFDLGRSLTLAANTPF